MSRLARGAVCALVLVAATGCSSGKKDSPPAATPSPAPSTSPSGTASAAEPSTASTTPTASSPAASSSSPTPSTSDSSTPAPSPSEAASPTVSTPPDVSSAPATAGPPDSAQLQAARELLVTGPQLGGDWVHVPGEEPELGDVCGTASAASIDRVLDVSWELVNPNYEGAARHGISRYTPGGAAAAARAMLDLLLQCKNVTQDFDGDSAVVNVTPQTPNMATFTLTFKSGAVNHGGIAVTDKGDYLSISTSYAGSPETAAELAGELDLRAQRKFKDAGVK